LPSPMRIHSGTVTFLNASASMVRFLSIARNTVNSEEISESRGWSKLVTMVGREMGDDGTRVSYAILVFILYYELQARNKK
jgi:hypothetical protein